MLKIGHIARFSLKREEKKMINPSLKIGLKFWNTLFKIFKLGILHSEQYDLMNKKYIFIIIIMKKYPLRKKKVYFYKYKWKD